jgi:hypothetical protein
MVGQYICRCILVSVFILTGSIVVDVNRDTGRDNLDEVYVHYFHPFFPRTTHDVTS